MVTKEAIDAALLAHSQWKKRLLDAIATGRSEFNPNVVKKDNDCQFGKWLYSLPQGDTKSDDYTTIKALHADFHKTAADILQLALSGEKDKALKDLEGGGQYGAITGKLVLALQAWKKS